MILVAILVFLVLAMVSALHLAWALGSSFPAADDATLSTMVTGVAHRHTMPPRPASALVAFATLIASLWALALGGVVASPIASVLMVIGGVALSLVFLARGLASYTQAWRRLTPVQPFARLDRIYFGPLCILLGAGFAFLTKGYTP